MISLDKFMTEKKRKGRLLTADGEAQQRKTNRVTLGEAEDTNWR